MRSTKWTCDNYCGESMMGERRPLGWIILNMDDSSMFVVCSYPCLAEWGWKAAAGHAMGTKAAVDGRLLESAS